MTPDAATVSQLPSNGVTYTLEGDRIRTALYTGQDRELGGAWRVYLRRMLPARRRVVR